MIKKIKKSFQYLEAKNLNIRNKSVSFRKAGGPGKCGQDLTNYLKVYFKAKFHQNPQNEVKLPFLGQKAEPLRT